MEGTSERGNAHKGLNLEWIWGESGKVRRTLGRAGEKMRE